MTNSEIPISMPAARQVPCAAWPRFLKRRVLLRVLCAVLSPTQRIETRTFLKAKNERRAHTLTTITANLWHDWPRHRGTDERLARFARLVEAQRADVLLLQEVWRTRRFRADAWLAERLGMHTAYLRANGHQAAIGFEEGVAVLSRYPLRRADALQWADGWFARRVALGVVLDTPWGEWLAVSTHLSLSWKRNAHHVLDLQRWTERQAAGRPALIGGDFNTDEHRPAIRHASRAWVDLFRQVVPYGDFPTHEIRWPWGGRLHAARLDYLFLKPGAARSRVEHAALLGSEHSDHRPVLARLRPMA